MQRPWSHPEMPRHVIPAILSQATMGTVKPVFLRFMISWGGVGGGRGPSIFAGALVRERRLGDWPGGETRRTRGTRTSSECRHEGPVDIAQELVGHEPATISILPTRNAMPGSGVDGLANAIDNLKALQSSQARSSPITAPTSRQIKPALHQIRAFIRVQTSMCTRVWD